MGEKHLRMLTFASDDIVIMCSPSEERQIQRRDGSESVFHLFNASNQVHVCHEGIKNSTESEANPNNN